MSPKTSDERHIVCTVRSQAQHRDRVKDLLLELVEPARREVGCLYYDLYQQIGEPDTFFIIDGWATEQAIAEHGDHPNVTRVVKELTPLLASPLMITTSNRVSERG